jgi:hypothetical protein
VEARKSMVDFARIAMVEQPLIGRVEFSALEFSNNMGSVTLSLCQSAQPDSSLKGNTDHALSTMVSFAHR